MDNQFYAKSALELAPLLLGKILVRKYEGKIIRAQIVETEAYCGHEDKGNHAYLGRRTPKNESMYLPGGMAYVYKCYGVHNMLNVVSGEKGKGEAVLIRAVEPIEGIDLMMENRGQVFKFHQLSGGPGKVTAAMQIGPAFDALPLYDFSSDLYLEEGDFQGEIYQGPRVGMSHHVGECANWERRFYIVNSLYVSKPRHVFYNFKK